MTCTAPSLVRRFRVALATSLCVIASVVPVLAQNVTISLPATNTFLVRNVSSSTAGQQTTITWSTNGNFNGGNHFRISVKADVANFSVPSSGRNPIPASNTSWTIASATNGTGSAGTLSSSAWVVVYNAANGKKSGSVTLNWNIAAPGSNIRAGNHLLTLHWRLEAAP